MFVNHKERFRRNYTLKRPQAHLTAGPRCLSVPGGLQRLPARVVPHTGLVR